MLLIKVTVHHLQSQGGVVFEIRDSEGGVVFEIRDSVNV